MMFTRRKALGVVGTLAFGGLGDALPSVCSAPAVAEEMAAALKPVRIVNSAGNTTLVLQEMLKQAGYLEKFGLDATSVAVGDGTKVMASLIGGEQDITMLTGLSQIFPAIEHGAKIKVLAGGSVLPLYTVYSNKPEVKSLKDLEGRTVGVASLGALAHVLMIALFEKKGVDVNKVKFVNVGLGSAEAFRAAAAGIVDAAPSSVEFTDNQADYGVHTLSDGNMWSELPEYTFQGAFATDEAITKKRDILVRVLAGYAKLFRTIQAPDSKDSFVQAWQAVITGGDPDKTRQAAVSQWERFQKYKPYAVDLAISEDRITYLQKLNVTVGSQKVVLPFREVADMSLAQDALKLIT